MLELDGLTRRYGEVVALDDVSFTVGEGQMFGFVGPNGAGKTTAMRIVLGVLHPDAGQVRWRGRPMDDQTVRGQLEYLAQLHGLDRSAARRSAAHWIERLGLSERAGDRVEALSLGNQQRVQLCAALVHDPELLVLDEPFSGLDPVGVDVLAGVLQAKAAAGTPVIFSSHQLELVERLCEAVAIINKGRLVASGAVAELRASDGRRRYRIEVSGAPAGWAEALPAAQVLDRANGRVVVELDAGADEQAVLDAARSAGRVTHFSAVEPTLTDLFRQAVRA